MRTLDWADVDEVVGLLRDSTTPDGHHVAVDTDPGKVAVPGVWVQVVAIDERHRLAGVTFRLRLFLMAPDVEHADVRRILAELHNAVSPVVLALGGTTGDVDVVTLTLPNGSAVPALSVPVDVETD